MMRRNTKNVPPPLEGWQPKRREHGGLLPVRRDKETNQLTFRGQTPDEVVELVVRQHPLFLIRPALPALGVMILLVVFSTLFIRFSVAPSISVFADSILSLLLVGCLIYFVWKDFAIWWFNIDIITTKRIVSCRGFLTPMRKNISLDKVVQISVDQLTPKNIFLRYGDVHVYQAGGQLVLKNVPNPGKVRDAVQGVFDTFKAARPPAEPLPQVLNPQVKAVIDKLGKKEKEPKLPNADDPYEHRRNPAKLRGPLRRFGGPLRLPAEVHYTPDEYTVMYIQRSKWLLALRLSTPAFVLLVDIVLAFILPAFFLLTTIAALVILIIMGLLTVNFVDDVFILTNKRIIDIERKYIFLYEAHFETEYKNIRETKIKMINVFQTFLDVGNVTVETPGAQPDINMTFVDHPFFVIDKINEIKGFKEKLDKAKDVNKRQDELIKWFSNVAVALEKKVASRGVPNLHRMDLWSAAAMAAEMGMKVVPIGEDDSYPQVETGLIVAQNPLPGTLMSVEEGRPQIQVTLSKRG